MLTGELCTLLDSKSAWCTECVLHMLDLLSSLIGNDLYIIIMNLPMHVCIYTCIHVCHTDMEVCPVVLSATCTCCVGLPFYH